MKRSAVIAALCMSLLGGCASLRSIDVVNPSEVTLEKAMGEVGKGLKAMFESRGPHPFGLIPASAEVQFRIAANAKDQSKLVLDMSRSVTPVNASREATAGIDISQESGGTRDNTITVKFVNLMTLPQNTLAYEKPEKLMELLQYVDGGPVVIFGKPPTGSVE